MIDLLDIMWLVYHGLAIGSIVGLFFIGKAILGKQGALLVSKEWNILGTKITYLSQNSSGVTITAKKVR